MIFYLLLAFLQSCPNSCSKPTEPTPEDQLHSYIESAVNIQNISQKDDLISFTTGDLKAALVNANNEAFERAYILRRYQVSQYEVLDRKDIDPKNITLEFSLTYKSWLPPQNPETSPITQVKNRASLVYDNGHWAVSKVESLTTNFIWENGILIQNDPVSAEQLKESETKEIISPRAE